MSFAEHRVRLASEVMQHLGESVVFTADHCEKKTIQVRIERNVEVIGEGGIGVQRKTRIKAALADVGQKLRNATFEFDNCSHVYDGTDSKDSEFISFWVTP